MKRSMLVCASVLLGLSLSGVATAHEAGKWVFRAGFGQVNPKSNNLSETVEVDGDSITFGIDVDTGTSLTLMGTYFFTQNWALDILAAWPFKHDVNAVVTVDVAGEEPVTASGTIAEVEHLPPTFSLQYHFLPDANFQPYAGLGVNYTTFTSEKLTELGSELADTLSLDDSFGFAAQLGADWKFNEKWLINFDLRWIDINSDLTVDGLDLGEVEIDPLVYSINIGYAF